MNSEKLSQDDIDELLVTRKPITLDEVIETKEWHRNLSVSIPGAVKAFNRDIYVLKRAKEKGMVNLIEVVEAMDAKMREVDRCGDGPNSHQLLLMREARHDEVEIHNIAFEYWLEYGI